MASRRNRTAVRTVALVLALALVGGVLWTAVASFQGAQPQGIRRFLHIHGLGVHPYDPQTVLLATHEGLIAVRGGTDWSWVGEMHMDMMGIVVSLYEPGVIFVSGHPGVAGPARDLMDPTGVLQSADLGLTWERLALEGQVDFHALTESTGRGTLYGWNVSAQRPVGLYRSNDRGHTWEHIPSADLPADPRVVLGLAAHPTDAERLVAATILGLLFSEDGGKTWQVEPVEEVYTAVAYEPGNPDRLWAYRAVPDSLLKYSDDGGQTWTATPFSLGQEDAVYAIAVSPHDPSVVYLGTVNMMLVRSLDGMATWQVLARAGEPVR